MEPAGRTMLARLRARERAACEAFVDAHYQGVHGFFSWLTRDREAAADLTQETFASFWDSTGRLDPARPPDLKAWLYGIARNRWRKRCRHERGAAGFGLPLEQATEVADAGAGPEALLLSALSSEAVAGAVAELPADYREALALRVLQDLSYSQVAEALGIGEGLARWRVHRARVWLREALSRAEQEEEKASVRLG